MCDILDEIKSKTRVGYKVGIVGKKYIRSLITNRPYEVGKVSKLSTHNKSVVSASCLIVKFKHDKLSTVSEFKERYNGYTGLFKHKKDAIQFYRSLLCRTGFSDNIKSKLGIAEITISMELHNANLSWNWVSYDCIIGKYIEDIKILDKKLYRDG